ncbi:response regulator [Paraliomyxa miuraensis]|uniref:response regulator n=1 Tax=Paraliomyxa miuraensis TaxID=376150 RepID=UPI0022525BB5|nr:response regulator [Paraliomyxa miuraensis]MCX4244383.1 response regulator [Paraliomyxa miuraensis]
MDHPSSIRILLIEDDEDDWIIIRELLATAEGADYELDWVTAFDDAVERLLSRTYDVALVDHHLGLHTGLDVLGVASEYGIPTPFILLTGQYRRELDLQAMGRGAVDFLVKGTLSADLLERAIRYAIHRARMDGELARARDEAIAANEHKSCFLANMSHELRTPLNGVIGMTSVMLSMPLRPEQRGIAESINTSAKSLMDLVNDVLDFSKIESGHVELEAVELDPAEILWDVCDVLISHAHAKDVELLCQLAPHQPRLCGDPSRLRQILTNLAANAVKFTSRGHVHIRLETEAMPDGRTQVTFWVHDTGIGIPGWARDDLFQPFTQVDSSMTRKFGGTGLGLSIAKHLVELMGGRIGYDSIEGEGSSFWFSVPLPTVARERAVDSGASCGRRILLVDANDVTAGTLVAHLEADGARCERASLAREALSLIVDRAAEGRPFDAVIADQPLLEPGALALCTALDTARSLGAARPRVVVLSRMNEASRALDQSLEAIAELLYKPPRPSRVLKVLGRPTREEPVHHGPATRSGRPHLLIADDNAINRRVAMAQIERLGCSADMVTNGLEALDALGVRSYDLILMDCQMPQMDGYEATREIRRRYRDAQWRPIIAVTASSRVEDRERCIAVGMDDFVAKPITLESLDRVLKRWLEPRVG